MDSYFFRVDHDLMRSEPFKALGGSAIKVYLVIGLYSDFGTGWAYPSIRTIARQAGLSRQTVLDALTDLIKAGILARSKSTGRVNAYRIIRQAPQRESVRSSRKKRPEHETVPESLVNRPEPGLESLEEVSPSGQETLGELARLIGRSGPSGRPNLERGTIDSDTTSLAIPGTPFRVSADGRLLVAVDLQELLTDQGLPKRTAERLVAQKDAESVAKVLLNAFYLRSQGKLQNGPGYIRAGIEEGYDLLPQVANQLESRRRELEASLRKVTSRQVRRREEAEQADEEAAIALVLERLNQNELQSLLDQAVASLPGPLVRRNPTLSNPFVRAKVYELACGEPLEEG
jgi:DNA-binding Lrp family transcriptional regulator